jgi:hypothetical protein
MEEIFKKENVKFSLQKVDNYNDFFEYKVNNITKKYVLLLNEYLKFILEKSEYKNNTYFKFIIIRGCHVITNIFNNILYYTNNLDLTFYHCQKAYYYYVEFIEQITNEQHSFLQLTSRDAMFYVYKKIFSDILYKKKEHVNNICSKELNDKLSIIDEYIQIFNNIFIFTIQNLNLNEENLNIIKKNNYKKICDKIINLHLEFEDCKILYNLIEKKNQKMFNNDTDNSFKTGISEYYNSLTNIITNFSHKNIDTMQTIVSSKIS